jgi:hypothetical protein
MRHLEPALALFSPGTSDFTCYQAQGEGKTGPKGSACSYVVPLQTFELKQGLHFEYEIETRFKALTP